MKCCYVAALLWLFLLHYAVISPTFGIPAVLLLSEFRDDKKVFEQF